AGGVEGQRALGVLHEALRGQGRVGRVGDEVLVEEVLAGDLAHVVGVGGGGVAQGEGEPVDGHAGPGAEGGSGDAAAGLAVADVDGGEGEWLAGGVHLGRLGFVGLGSDGVADVFAVAAAGDWGGVGLGQVRCHCVGD